jgi:hypothetical protein
MPRYAPRGLALRYDPLMADAPVHAHGGTCTSCGSSECHAVGYTPLSYARHVLTSGSGCSEMYWGDLLSDHPETCDPCDDCGNWVGPRACEPYLWEKVVAGFGSLWGYRAGFPGADCAACAERALDESLSAPVEEFPVPAIVQPSSHGPAARGGPRQLLRSARFAR